MQGTNVDHGMTIQLLNITGSCQKRRFWQERFAAIHRILLPIHGTPTLGNVKDPAWEVIYILLSAQTTEVLYQRTYRALRKAFPALGDVARAPLGEILKCVGQGGFGKRRAKQIQQIARLLLKELGDKPGRQIRKMSTRECFDYLLGLPGVGPKSALCVMMYSLDLDVFPVDVNVHRIAQRLGALPKRMIPRQSQHYLPWLVPNGACKALHICMVLHGRTVCTPRKAICHRCEISTLCRTGRRRLRSKLNL